jgi:DNA-binding NtrC family response regulator
MSRTPDVVIVDHDLEALKKLVEPLRNEFEFYLTISGNDALTTVARNPIGLIIAGQTLFSGSGIEVLIQVRSRSPRTTRVLLANAVERKAVEGVLERAEVFQVLKRPCTAEQLREVLQAASWSARMRPEAGGTVEHVVLETGEHRSLSASASGAPVTVLTNDSGLFEAIRSAVHEHHDVHLATRESEAIELAAAGQCAVLVTDQALTQSALERATHALRTREPALVTVAAGSREQGNALMGLLGNGQIHRFLLKPVAPGLARLAIDSAARQHSSLKAHPRHDAGHRPAVRHEAPHRAGPQRCSSTGGGSGFRVGCTPRFRAARRHRCRGTAGPTLTRAILATVAVHCRGCAGARCDCRGSVVAVFGSHAARRPATGRHRPRAVLGRAGLSRRALCRARDFERTPFL